MATSNKVKDMPVNKLMVQMGIPMILSMALQAVYNIVDSAFVGNMKAGSEEAFSALVRNGQANISLIWWTFPITEFVSCVVECIFLMRMKKTKVDVLTVFIHGNVPQKAERICRLYQIDESAAMKMMQDVDKRRSMNYSFYTEQKWGMASNYTLSLNSSELGYEMCEKMIIECAWRD